MFFFFFFEELISIAVFGWPVPVAGADFVERSTASWLVLVAGDDFVCERNTVCWMQ